MAGLKAVETGEAVEEALEETVAVAARVALAVALAGSALCSPCLSVHRSDRFQS